MRKLFIGVITLLLTTTAALAAPGPARADIFADRCGTTTFDYWIWDGQNRHITATYIGSTSMLFGRTLRFWHETDAAGNYYNSAAARCAGSTYESWIRMYQGTTSGGDICRPDAFSVPVDDTTTRHHSPIGHRVTNGFVYRYWRVTTDGQTYLFIGPGAARCR